MSDTGDLGDSPYEIINSTDSESADGRFTDRLTESVSSLDVPRPGDVMVLDESAYGSDRDSDEESDHSSRASSIRYADQALQNPSSSRLAAVFSYGSSNGTISPSIEFQEGDNIPIDMDSVSVKHTIREFSSEEAALITRDLGLQEPPKRLVATIRQSMSQRCLSTCDTPLRVLYVGSESGRRDIVKKLSSAICASRTNSRSVEGVYNICQISSFFSSTEPEVELMESSPYQIKVEHCTSAEILGDGEYSITMVTDKKHHISVSRAKATAVPKWDLPHLVVFYCTEIDDESTVSTRNTTWEIMTRSGVPAMFISHAQSFDQPLTGRWKQFLNPSALHMCLESRDPDVVLERMPIDLNSFMNIDARQMNRNLAFLTGLAEAPQDSVIRHEQAERRGRSSSNPPKLFAPSAQAQILRLVERNKWSIVRIVLMMLMVPLSLPLFNRIGFHVPYRSDLTRQPSYVPVTTIGSWPLSSVSTPATKLSTAAMTTTTVTSTVTVNITSTKTKIKQVKSRQAEAPASSLASALSFAGLLSDRPSSVVGEPESRTTVCSVEVHGDKEILVKIPSASKATWLAKGAIDIDVYRGDEPVKTKLSSVDEGILVEIKNKEDAYGVLNVSIITTRKPKINETFEVDFGKALFVEALEAGMHRLQDMVQRVAGTVDDALHVLEGAATPVAALAMDRIHQIREAPQNAQRYSRRVAIEAVRRLENLMPRGDIAKSVKGMKEGFSKKIEVTEDIGEDVKMTFLRAQISSRLWWLKMQGKKAEYDEYERKAGNFLMMRHNDMLMARLARKNRAQQTSVERACGFPGTKWMCRQNREATAARDKLWKKILG